MQVKKYSLPQVFAYTLESAIEANKKGGLFQWTLDYLRGEGANIKLAKHLSEGEPKYIELVEFPLSRLKRIMGPEKGMLFTESEGIWEKRVDQFVRKDLEIADGGHRQEALLRCSYEKYWTIFLYYKKG